MFIHLLVIHVSIYSLFVCFFVYFYCCVSSFFYFIIHVFIDLVCVGIKLDQEARARQQHIEEIKLRKLAELQVGCFVHPTAQPPTFVPASFPLLCDNIFSLNICFVF